MSASRETYNAAVVCPLCNKNIKICTIHRIKITNFVTHFSKIHVGDISNEENTLIKLWAGKKCQKN